MKAKITITALELRDVKLLQNPGQIGHSFILAARVKTVPRTLGHLSGDDIDFPKLEWIETICWHRFDTTKGDWVYAGCNTNHENLYQTHPTSRTFDSWQKENRYAFARNAEKFPIKLKKSPDSKIDQWMVRNGFEWEILTIDIPQLSLETGSGGGAGASLIIGPTRRRVIHFELGFTGYPVRIYCTQILETRNGVATINAFIPRKVSHQETMDPQKLALWSNAVNF